MKSGVYAGYCLYLAYLFRRYHYRPPPEYTDILSENMEGVKRIANMARANGEVSRVHYECFCLIHFKALFCLLFKLVGEYL